MKGLKNLYHFLGGIYFALLLIAATALFVVAGTLLESHTQSHLYAEQFIYSNPIFALLLWGFFINILFSAIRRWPFQVRHIPFLTTHFGLLMILAGTLAKHYFGIQGSLFVLEGSGSHEMVEPGSYAIYLESHSTRSPLLFPLKKGVFGFEKKITDSPLKLTLAGFSPHSEERLASWIKGDVATILGLDPLPVIDYDNSSDKEIPLGGKVRFYKDAPPWNLYALRTAQVQHLMQQFSKGKLIQPPALIFIEDEKHEVTLAGVDEQGVLWKRVFPNEPPNSVIAYEDGFKGYSLRSKLPIRLNHSENESRELAGKYLLKKQLQQAVAENLPLAPPLQFFQNACKAAELNFAETLIDFLVIWGKTKSWLFPEAEPLSPSLTILFHALDWQTTPKHTLLACQWCSGLFSLIEPPLQSGENLNDILKKLEWPLLEALEPAGASSERSKLLLITQQIFAATEWKPIEPDQIDTLTPSQNARLFSAYLRAYDISEEAIFPILNSKEDVAAILEEMEKEDGAVVELEALIAPMHRSLPPGNKLEDNTPRIIVNVQNGTSSQMVSLVYDRPASGLKWPIFNGEYLIRFQPSIVEIPYHVRLRNARQINYPHSQQAYSYESDVLISDRRDGSIIEKTLSMNHVHETKEGYRFYLSSISQTNDQSVKRIQLAVNYDPAKYWLTYPGAFILTFGILLLFWMKPYKKKEF